MKEDIKGIKKFKDSDCHMEDTLEQGVCRNVNKARNLLIDGLEETKKSNRDTQRIQRLITDSESTMKANMKLTGSTTGWFDK